MSNIPTLCPTGIMLRIACEYDEMPGLTLTPDQGARLWTIPRGQVLELLDRLVEGGVLRRSRAGTYVRA